MAESIVTRIAEEFAEQKVSRTRVTGVDLDLMHELWKGHALEILAFALPRLGLDEDGLEHTQPIEIVREGMTAT